jgi:hypothetical protein
MLNIRYKEVLPFVRPLAIYKIEFDWGVRFRAAGANTLYGLKNL